MTGAKSGNFLFDTFISYHESDKDWVTAQLIHRLESEGINVCWDDKDFLPGRTVIENKLNALCSSSSVIIVLSPDYVQQENMWTLLREKCGVEDVEILSEFNIVPILLRPCNMPQLFARLWKLDWTNEVAKKYFWHKLIKTVKNFIERKQQHVKNYLVDAVGREANYRETTASEKGPENIQRDNGRTTCMEDYQKAIVLPKRQVEQTEEQRHVTKQRSHEIENNVISPKEQVQQKERQNHFTKQRSHEIESDVVISTKEQMQQKVKQKHLTKQRSHEIKNDVLISPEEQVLEIEKQKMAMKEKTHQTENDEKDDFNKKSKLLEKLNPRILSLFVPEDDDLTRQDIEELTFKIENVNLENQSSCSLDDSREGHVHEEVIYDHPLKTKRQKLEKFDSQQEQILILDFLQEKDMKIRQKFENCCECGRKRAYRRLLERFDKAICSTVNGEKDTLLLASLPISELSLDENRGFSCSCCDQQFHSGRALQLHIAECVRQAWVKLLNNPAGKR